MFAADVAALQREGIAALSIDPPDGRDPYVRPITTTPDVAAEAHVRYVTDLRRGLDVLRSLPAIDADRLGYVGYSWGGFVGGYLAGLRAPVRAYVLTYAGADWVGADPTAADGFAADPAAAVGAAPPRRLPLHRRRGRSALLARERDALLRAPRRGHTRRVAARRSRRPVGGAEGAAAGAPLGHRLERRLRRQRFRRRLRHASESGHARRGFEGPASRHPRRSHAEVRVPRVLSSSCCLPSSWRRPLGAAGRRPRRRPVRRRPARTGATSFSPVRTRRLTARC